MPDNASCSFSFNQYTKPSLVVLENVGNSTYMSCVLQCLTNIKPIAKYYLKELNSLKELVGNTIPIKLISMDITDNKLSDLETRWGNKARDLSEEVRQILVEQNPAMRFCNIEKTEIVANK